MYLSRLRVRNFRNFHHLDVKLGPTSVVVGENSVGKSNLLFALRLILDPKLSDFSRHLREEDFWEGLNEPVRKRETISVEIEFQDFQKNQKEFAVLQSFCVQGPVPDTARLTYVFRPISPLPRNRDLTIEDYTFLVYGGLNEKNKVDYSFRKWIPIEVLPALRDAERDLAAWRQSPLRPLVDGLSISRETLENVAEGIDKATDQLLAEQDVKHLSGRIQSRLSKMVGSVLEIDPSLGFVPTIPARLTRALRLFGDGQSRRPVGELSLGVDNLLYLLLLAIELERKEEASERATTFLAIEEPEAHLHPHLQRLVFRDFLRRESPIFLTTHSPHIASVAPLESIVLLRDDRSFRGSKGTSTLQATLADQEIADIERYLDATRAEILFARGVILVEGATELFLIPAVAENMGKLLDHYGISVCSVHGVDFVPYAKLLGPKGLNIPFVILTDGDRYETKSGYTASRGLSRAVSVANAIGHPSLARLKEMRESRQWNEMREAACEAGVFVGNRTLEVDLFDCGHGQSVVDSVRELSPSSTRIAALQELAERGTKLNECEAKALMKTIERIGKGRVAQRLAGRITAERFPAYVTNGILQITEAVS